MKTTMIAIALAGFALVPAAQAGETFPFEFEYSAQELNSETGATEVYERLKAQVEDACEFTNSRRGVTAANIEKKCIEAAMDATVRDINSDQLKLAHVESTKTSES